MTIETVLQTITDLKTQINKVELNAIEKDIVKYNLASIYQLLMSNEAISKPKANITDQHVSKTIEETREAKTEEIIIDLTENSVDNQVKDIKLINEKVGKPEISTQIEQAFFDTIEKSQTLADKFSYSSKGLNERASESDLKKLIDFNRQYVFIQELFGNDPTAYTEAIHKINSSATLNEAIAYVNQQLIPRFNWNKEMPSVKLFDKILKQRFGL
jgi:hypothetical protein